MRVVPTEALTHDFDVYVRQSWVKDWVLCPHRAMFKHTVEDGPTDSTILGTALHHAIEFDLMHNVNDVKDLVEAAVHKFVDLANGEEGNVRWVKNDYLQCLKMLEAMVPAWRKSEVRHDLILQQGYQIEKEFCVQVAEFFIGFHKVRLWFEGRTDLVAQTRVWDWKTASQDYKAWEAQRWYVQPTVYTEAARQLGWINGDTTEFSFMVFPKRMKDVKPYVVTVQRDRAHTLHLVDMLKPAIAGQIAGIEHWPKVDQHALCSDKYCPLWSQCKGQYIDNTTWLGHPQRQESN